MTDAASRFAFALALTLGAPIALASACGGLSARESEREGGGASPMTTPHTGGVTHTGGASPTLGGTGGTLAGTGSNVGGVTQLGGSGNVATGGASSGTGGVATGGSGGSLIEDAGMPDANDPVVCAGKLCAPGERCNAWTRVCQPLDVPYPPSGQDNGGSCTTESDCRSAGSGLPNDPLCVTQNGADFCVSYCELPADVNVQTTFVRSDCPAGSVCLPSDLRYSPGETIGTCVPECQSDATCRIEDGYYCRNTYIYPPRTFTNGYCAPAHCKSRGCAGFVCGC